MNETTLSLDSQRTGNTVDFFLFPLQWNGVNTTALEIDGGYALYRDPVATAEQYPDADVFPQSADAYLIVIDHERYEIQAEDTQGQGTRAVRDENGRPFQIVGDDEVVPARSGDEFIDDNGEPFLATREGWVPAGQAELHTYGEVI